MDMTIDQITAMLNASVSSADATPEERRAGMLESSQPMRPHEDVTIEAITLGGVPGQKLTPANAISGRTLLYFHGGGYVVGSTETHKGLVSYIAHAMQATAYSMDYRMGPEDYFPAAVNDGLAAYKALLESGVDPENIIISGDSAGGGLTMATALKAKDNGTPLPAGLIPLSPWVNLNQIGASYDTKADVDPMVSREGLGWYTAHYLGPDGDADDPYASPVYGDLTGLPPMLIQVGASEVLYSDSITLAERAGAANVRVTLESWPQMIHVFQIFYPFLKDSRDAIQRIGAWGAAHTKV